MWDNDFSQLDNKINFYALSFLSRNACKIYFDKILCKTGEGEGILTICNNNIFFYKKNLRVFAGYMLKIFLLAIDKFECNETKQIHNQIS